MTRRVSEIIFRWSGVNSLQASSTPNHELSVYIQVLINQCLLREEEDTEIYSKSNGQFPRAGWLPGTTLRVFLPSAPVHGTRSSSKDINEQKWRRNASLSAQTSKGPSINLWGTQGHEQFCCSSSPNVICSIKDIFVSVYTLLGIFTSVFLHEGYSLLSSFSLKQFAPMITQFIISLHWFSTHSGRWQPVSRKAILQH